MRVERTFHINVDPLRLWPLVSNTDSLNRKIGLSEVDYEFIPVPTAGRRSSGAATPRASPAWSWNTRSTGSPREYAVERDFSARAVQAVGGGSDVDARVDRGRW